MELYLKQTSIPGHTLFLIQDASGRLLYRLWGNPRSLRSVFALMDEHDREKARILRVGTAEMGMYEIRLYQGDHIRVICQKAIHRGSMLVQGNLPNIVAAEKLGIKSREWASIAVPTGLALMAGYFIALSIIL